MAAQQRRTKILATLGPATDAPGVLEALVSAGVDVVRLNFSHGSAADHAARVARIRAAAQAAGREVGILGDLQGPKIRIERFAIGKVALKTGEPFALYARDEAPPGDASGVGVSYLGLVNDVKPGDVLLLDDGLVSLRVETIAGDTIHTTVLNDGFRHQLRVFQRFFYRGIKHLFLNLRVHRQLRTNFRDQRLLFAGGSGAFEFFEKRRDFLVVSTQ